MKLAPTTVNGIGTSDGEHVERINQALSRWKRIKYMIRCSKHALAQLPDRPLAC